MIYKNNKRLGLKGKTMVVIDWANVWGWKHEHGYKTEIGDLAKVLKTYKNISKVCLYFGEDVHPKSVAFLEEVRSLGYEVVSKPVKYQDGVRKCNFDVEIVADSLAQVEDFDSYLFFSGDGDFAYLYNKLIEKNKQVVVVFGKNSLGRELHGVKHLFLLDFRNFAKKYPPRNKSRGPRLNKLSNKKGGKSS